LQLVQRHGLQRQASLHLHAEPCDCTAAAWVCVFARHPQAQFGLQLEQRQEVVFESFMCVS
jgi:hypothetical protein